MKFLKIRNRGATDRGALEYLGFTTKRDSDDQNTVGVNGSGAKFAAIAALRRNIPMCTTSVDEQGPYTLNHMVKEERVAGRTVQCIVYRYSAGVEVSTKLLLDSFHRWDKPVGKDGNDCYPILRELMANAHDADRDFTMTVVDDQSVDFTSARADETIVYIAHRPEFEAVLQEPNRYFKFITGTKPLFSLPGIGDIYPKSDRALTRIFVRGVLRYCSEHQPSIFDYSIQDRGAVSEEGLLRIDTGAVYDHLAKLMLVLDNVEVAKAVLLSALRKVETTRQAPVERTVLSYAGIGSATPSESARKAFRQAWSECFGDTAVMGGASSKNDRYAASVNRVVISVPWSGLRGFLEKCGILQARELVTVNRNEIEEVALHELPPHLRERAQRGWDVYLKYCPDAAGMKLYFYRQTASARCQTLGYAGGNYSQIWLSTLALEREFRDIVGTLAHEHRHCRTKKLDTDFGFWRPTDNDIADTIIRAEGLDPKTGEPLPKKDG